ncbi:hypothetical protein Tco_0883332 [Tanacetum coccineum]
MVSPFLCSVDSEANSESEPFEQRPERHESLIAHDAMVSMWRDKVASRSSSPSGSSSHDTLTPSSEFPIAPVVAPPGIRRRPTTLIRPGEAIPFGRPYHTHPNGPHKLLTLRKRVGPFLARRLAWRRVSHRLLDRYSLPDFTSDSSSSGSSLDSSPDTSSGSPSDSLSDTSSVHSSRFDASSQTHSGPATRVASSRLVYPPVMTPLYSEAFRHWRSASLSTPYLPMTSKSFLESSSKRSLDSYSLSAALSRKRCRSPTASVPLSTPILRSIAPTHANLLPPRKRFRDSYSPEDSREEHMEIGTADAAAIVDLGICDGVRTHTEDGLGMGVKISTSDIKDDEEEFKVEASEGGTVEVEVEPRVGPVVDEDVPGHVTADGDVERQLEDGQLIASGERASLAYRIRRLGRENLRVRALLSIKRDRVDSIRHHMALSQEEFCHIRRDRDDAWRRFRRLESFVESRNIVNQDMTIIHSGMTPEAIKELITHRVAEALANYEATRAANNIEAESQSQNGSDSDNGNGGNGNGNHGDGGNNINGNPNKNGRGSMSVARMYTYQDFVKCQPLNKELKEFASTWWNSHKRTVGVDVAFSMTWRDLMKLMTKVFQELTLLCTKMVPGEDDQIKRYVGGLPDNIQGNVMQGHFKKDCPKPKNQNHGNKPVIPEARGKAYAIGGGDVNPGSNVVTFDKCSNSGVFCEDKLKGAQFGVKRRHLKISENLPIRCIQLRRYGVSARRLHKKTRLTNSQYSVSMLSTYTETIDKETHMAEPNNYITATQKNFVSNDNNDNEGRMVEKCIIEIQGAAYEWFTKECMGSITTWDSMVEKFILKFHHLSDHNDDEEIKEEEDLNKINNAPKIFMIEGNLFDFETPLYEAFNEFNRLLKIDIDLFTYDIQNLKTYDDYKQELNNDKAKGTEEPWSEKRVPYQLCHHICEPYRFKNGKTKWPICTFNIDGFCNGGELPGMVRVGSMTYFQDHRWYDELADGKLKDETLALKAKIEGS